MPSHAAQQGLKSPNSGLLKVRAVTVRLHYPQWVEGGSPREAEERIEASLSPWIWMISLLPMTPSPDSSPSPLWATWFPGLYATA